MGTGIENYTSGTWTVKQAIQEYVKDDMQEVFDVIPSKSDTTKTTNYTVQTSDNGTPVILGSSTTADKTFTMDSVGSSEDGYVWYFINRSEYSLTITPSDSDTIGNSGQGYGIELPDKGTMVGLRYDHGSTHFDIIYKTGRVFIEGLKFYEPMYEMNAYGVDSRANYLIKVDNSRQHAGIIYNNIEQYRGGDSDFPPGCWSFGGSDEYVSYNDSTDWDFFGVTSGTKTLHLSFCNVSSGSQETYVSQHEDSNNFWKLFKTTSDALAMNYTTTGTAQVDVSGGSITSGTWYSATAVVKDGEFGLYLGSAQVAYTSSFSTDTFSGSFDLGRNGTSGDYLTGREQNVMFCHQNYFNANPNSGLTDTITTPVKLLNAILE